MKKLALLLMFLTCLRMQAATDAVTIDHTSFKVLNPTIIFDTGTALNINSGSIITWNFGSGDTLNFTGATVSGISGSSITFPGTLSIASGKTLTSSNTLTFTGTDSSTLNIGTGGTLGTAAYISSTAGGDLTGTLPSPTIAANAVTNSKLATMAANTMKANATGSSATPTDVAVSSSLWTPFANGANAFSGIPTLGSAGQLTLNPSSSSSYLDNTLAIGNLTTDGTLGKNGYAAFVLLDRYSNTNGVQAFGVNGDSTLPGVYSGVGYWATGSPIFSASGFLYTDNEYDIALGDDIGGGYFHRQIELLYQDPAQVKTTATTTSGSAAMTITGSTSGLSAISGGRVYGPGVAIGTTWTISGTAVTLSANATQTTTSHHGGTGDYYVFCPTTVTHPRTGYLRGWNATNNKGPVALYWEPVNGQVAIGGTGSASTPTITGSASLSTPSLAINGSLLSLAGNLTTSGAFASTFTMTGTTAVTFPTSGTLATNGGGSSITFPGTLSIASGKTLTSSNTLTFTGTDSSSVNFGAGGTPLYFVVTNSNSTGGQQSTGVKNTNSGSSAACNWYVQNDQGGGQGLRMGITSSGFTTSGLFHATGAYLEAQQCNDLTIKTDNNNPIIFGGSTTQWLKLTAALASGLVKVDGSNVASVATTNVDYDKPPTMTSNATGTITFNNSSLNETIYDTSASTIANGTITLPTTSVAGQIVRYVTAGIITTVTMAGGTVDVGAAITTLAANSSVAWQCDTNGHWLRIQ